MNAQRRPLHVTLVGTPDTQVSPLSGLFETLTAFDMLASIEPNIPARPFRVEILAPEATLDRGASGLPLGARATPADIASSDIVIVPLMMVHDLHWKTGRYPRLVEWLRLQHARGAVLASACTGVLLLAETGLLDGRQATLHWAFAPTFRQNFPAVTLRTEEALMVTGTHHELVMTGGVMSWHDLALFLISRYVGLDAARAMGRLLMLEWHDKGQAPYIDFVPFLDHGDAQIAHAQRWLATHYMVPNPVDELVARIGLTRRTLERRFRKATSLAPIAYIQQVRISQARRRLEHTNTPVDQIGLDVGYENASFFRRLFYRTTHLTPSAYRRKFQLREPSGSRHTGRRPPKGANGAGR